MREIIHNGHHIRIYDDVESLPIVRYQLLQKYQLINSGLGANMEALDASMNGLAQMIDRGDKAAAIQQVLNMRIQAHFMMNQTNPQMMAFGPLIESVDGNPFDDLTENGIKGILEKIGRFGISYATVKFIVNEVKKKLKRRWRSSSPKSKTRGKKSNTTDTSKT